MFLFSSSSNMSKLDIGEYSSLLPNCGLIFFAGVIGWNLFVFLALIILEEKPYSGTDKYTFLSFNYDNWF